MLRMSFRNLFRQKRRSLLTALTMFGGFLLGSLAIGLSDGSFNGIVNAFTRTRLGHIQVHAKGYRDRPSLNKVLRDYRRIGAVIEAAPGAESWAPRVYAAGLVSVGERTDTARIVGIDPELETRATGFDRKVTSGRGFSAGAGKEAVLGAGLARALKASLGDGVTVVSQAADGSLANDTYTLVGLAETGDMAEDRTTMFLRLDDARELFALDDSVHEIVVVARSLGAVKGLNAALHERLAGEAVDVEPWQEFARSFYEAMRADRRGHSMQLLVLVIVVAIGVLNTALMSVLERRREFGILKALGTRPRRVFGLILVEIQLLALLSVLGGFAVSLPLNAWLSDHPLPLTSEPMTIGGMQWESVFVSEVNARIFVVPAATILLSAFLVSLMPALKAARTEPAQSIRMT